MKRIAGRLKIPVLVLVVVLAVAMVAAPRWMRQEASDSMYTSIQTVPPKPAGIVFGALVFPDGSMSDMLIERVQTGVALYKAGKVGKLLLTGNDSGPSYDEVAPMKALTLKMGVPEGAILVDGKSYRTYDSCARAKSVFHIRSAVLVTQDFHMPRAVYLARHLGIDAVGYNAPPAHDMLTRAVEDLRERFAVLFALSDIYLHHRPG